MPKHELQHKMTLERFEVEQAIRAHFNIPEDGEVTFLTDVSYGDDGDEAATLEGAEIVWAEKRNMLPMGGPGPITDNPQNQVFQVDPEKDKLAQAQADAASEGQRITQELAARQEEAFRGAFGDTFPMPEADSEATEAADVPMGDHPLDPTPTGLMSSTRRPKALNALAQIAAEAEAQEQQQQQA